MEHTFTGNIKSILQNYLGKEANEIFEKSLLIQYLNEKTRSANKGSKARSSFANLYAIYVIIEDYLSNGFDQGGDYSEYEGAPFLKLFTRQRELPFGGKLQNHALNNRMNSEFQKYFPNSGVVPIIRNLETSRYWINENLLKIEAGEKQYNIAKPIIEIINEYVEAKQVAFKHFVQTCREVQELEKESPATAVNFISGLLAKNVDARLFEITSYAILKYYFHGQKIIWGFEMDKLNTENLKLYKTGRTNANDGGIDFVMKPLGRFFQVTETLDFKKYFLDIDKIQKYPITFVIKSEEPVEGLMKRIRDNASKTYPIKAIVDRYMGCIEEIINIPILKDQFNNVINQGHLSNILFEIAYQGKVEFNFEEIEPE
jgi:hypothetical protein